MKTTKEELAAMLHGREIGDETTPEIIAAAKASNLLIVYGASDDLCEFEGAFREEVDCYNGGIIHFTKDGSVWHKDYERADYQRGENGACFEAVWGADTPDGRVCSWHYKTELPHATFDVMEDGELYCVGMVIDMNELP